MNEERRRFASRACAADRQTKELHERRKPGSGAQATGNQAWRSSACIGLHRSLVTWMLVIATLVTLGVAVQQYYRVTLKLQDPLGGHINDFDRWMIMAPRFLHDRVDYVDDQFPTPPLSLLALAPFTTLSRPAAQFAWVCLKLPLALMVFALSAGIVSRSGSRLTASAMALI